MAGTLLLEWGTVKGWSDLDEGAVAALQKFVALGMSMSAMTQPMTDAHKSALCDAIDHMDKIQNAWSGEVMTREEAKKYVMEYSR